MRHWYRILSLCVLTLLSSKAHATLQFIQNRGQWDPKILYRAELSEGYLLIGKNQMAYVLYDNRQLADIHNKELDSARINAHSIVISFEGANSNSSIFTEFPSSEYYNYYYGNDSRKWVSGLKAYGKLTIQEIYPGIDFELFENEGTLKYNFIVKAQADPSLIRMKYRGSTGLSLSDGELRVGTSLTDIIELKPLVYQENGDEKTIISSEYTLNDSILSFRLITKHSRRKPLIIDPVLVFSTYSGSKRDNFGFTATYDHLANAYAGGAVYRLGTTFPTTPGAFQAVFRDGDEIIDTRNQVYDFARDCGISKYSSDGTSLLYCTYLGGTRNEQPHSLVVNKANELIVFGTTKSADFPIDLNGPGYNVFQRGKSDIFIIRFNENGTAMLAGTYMGGSGNDGLNGDDVERFESILNHNYADDFRGEVVVDENDYVYVASCTNSSDFPLKNNISSYSGNMDACIFKLSPDLTKLEWSHVLGGSDNDAAYGVALGLNDNLYVTGGTASFNMSFGFNGYNTARKGGPCDGFLINLSRVDGGMRNSTYVGTDGYDQSYMVQTDKYGAPFVYGQTTGMYPVTAGVYKNNNGRQFISKFSPDLKQITISTTFGSGRPLPDISPTSFLVDECERVFVSGWGGGTNQGHAGGSTSGMPVTANALQKNSDGSDFYLAVFSKNMEELLYGSYFGGVGNGAEEHVDGGTSRFDKKGVIYQSVCSDCNSGHNFPTTPTAKFPTNPSPRCSNAIFKIDFENFNRKPIVRDTVFTVTATDMLEFDYTGTDKDRHDSLKIEFSGPVLGGGSIAAPYCNMVSQVTDQTKDNTITSSFRWNTGCQHLTGDTIRIKARIYDRGCPTQDSNTATIKIVVQPPPPMPMPDVICLNFGDDGSVSLKWDAFATSKYANYIVLYRKNPNGSIKALDTLRTNKAGSYIDKGVTDPKNNNYCYYFISHNICNIPYDNGYRVCSQVEYSTPIDSTYMITATVVENRNVQIRWFKSKEADFSHYSIYRSDNKQGGKPVWKLVETLKDIDDTTWTDTKVDVQNQSYCYRIIVADLCGHFSTNSNPACNIVLSGESKPFYFDINWTEYRQWEGGVASYELYRRVDTGSLRPVILTPGNTFYYKDDKLDYWWGGYFYRIKAYEGTNSSGKGYGAWSESNDLYLYQPPLLHVPNAFSPNRDGVNDEWGFVPVFVREFNMQVYDRWGQKVFDTDYKGRQWDGKTLGDLADNDVFIWIATYKGWDNRVYHQKGTVTVMP